MNTRVRGTCTVGDCGRPHAARGYCSTHYTQWRRRGEVNPERLTKPRRPTAHGTLTGYIGHGCKCDLCLAAHREYQREWNLANRKRRRDIERKATYGMEPGTYDRMLVEQGCRCAICGGPGGKKGLVIDHDHETGKVRGLLCSTCNTGIGHLCDDADLLLAAAAYLLKSTDVLGAMQ